MESTHIYGTGASSWGADTAVIETADYVIRIKPTGSVHELVAVLWGATIEVDPRNTDG